ncbi:MAG: ABC transporter permease subunit [Planctomycetota bacterium]|nr:ABC transporter permease subunit [Planctomycetota bacterium]
MADKTFTGLNRERTTPRSVKTAETVARTAITAGGIGTILAVLLIFVFLLWVVVPLFSDADVEPASTLDLKTRGEAAEIIRTGVDDAQLLGWSLHADGRLRVRRLQDGALVDDLDLFDGKRPTCWSFSPDGPDCAFGFEDGTVRTGTIQFEESFLERNDENLTEEALKLRVGGSVRFQNGVLSKTPEDQWRFDRLAVEMSAPDAIAQSAIRLIDYSLPSNGRAFGYLTADGKLGIRQYFRRFNPMMDAWVEDPFDKPIVYRPKADRGEPAFLRLFGQGNSLMLLWADGYGMRFDARETVMAAGGELEVVETVQVVPEGRTLDRIEFLIGKTTLIAADERGALTAWFPTRPAGAYARDGIQMAQGHRLTGDDGVGARATAFSTSLRSRQLAVGFDDGTVRLFHVTTDQLLLEVSADSQVRIEGLALTPKEDGLVAWFGGSLQRWLVDPGHPAATLSSLFGRVWYEGQEGPAYTWQSEGGSDDFEPKLGVMVLVFGTLKATLYSMLIAVPIALLAALFTSEFLTPRWRAPLKSVIEMMASLPSVVLGFLAAIVLAPFVDSVLITVLCVFVTLPVTVILGARLWQFLPGQYAIRWSGMPRFLAICLTLPLAVLMAQWIAPGIESLCFNGDIDGWLNRGEGTNAGGWTFLLIPLCMVGAAIAFARFAGPWLRSASAGWSRAQCALADVVRFAIVIAGGVFIAWALGSLLGGGLDPRESIVGQYQKRNALIVGFVMGFAIVPIIYTLAEDALSSVPQQLREGSLGCGATPWQTGIRIVVPAAMSGLFGAMMVGLGRAVGETMIVLMAAGNTGIMDWNMFNGFRTLSANIATELPEAVVGSTHYRVLFMCGLVLFAMTFVINTIAELVRRHFRKRFADL